MTILRPAVPLLAFALLLPCAARAQEAPADTAAEIRRAVEMSEVERAPSFADRRQVARLVDEAYPAALKTAGVGGSATVRLVVDARGRPLAGRVHESSGRAELDGAALRVAAGLRFIPAQRGGETHPVWVNLPVAFVAPAQVDSTVPADAVFEMTEVDDLPVLENRDEVSRAITREYNTVLRASGVFGNVTLELLVDRAGAVTEAAVEAPHPELEAPALRVAKLMRFRPARVGGEAVRVRVVLPLTIGPR